MKLIFIIYFFEIFLVFKKDLQFPITRNQKLGVLDILEKLYDCAVLYSATTTFVQLLHNFWKHFSVQASTRVTFSNNR